LQKEVPVLSRRQFIWTTAATGVVVSVGGARRAFPFAQSPATIRKFVTTLPGLGPAGANNIGQYIPLAVGTEETFAGLTTDVYRLAVRQFSEKLHPDLPKATTLWGYADSVGGVSQYLGGVIVAKRGKPVLFHVSNQLPKKSIIPVDPTLMAGPDGLTVGDLPFNRIATHLHGGFTPWFSDGTPFQWFTPGGEHGISFYNVPGTSPPPGTGTYYYPMDQSARLVWYHDHAIGITRTNAYAGIASALVITDAFEAFLLDHGLLPDLVGIPLVIQDKSFVPTRIHTEDPSWRWGDAGDLWYPHQYEFNSGPFGACMLNAKGRFDYGPCDGIPPAVLPPAHRALPNPSVVPEFFADTAMVNGAPYPVLNVTDKTFRFRLLNGSQARFWHLNLYYESSIPGEADTNLPGPTMYQVGTEGGFLPAVAEHPNGIPCPLSLDEDESGNTANPDGPFNLLLAPAERVDVLIDFTGLTGQSFILYNDAPGPFPGGDPRNDYFTGDPDLTASGGAPTTVAGHGPNTRTILKIVVGSGSPGPLPNLAMLNIALANNFAGGNPGVDPQQPALLAPFNQSTNQFEVPAGTPILNKTLNEDFDDFGRLLQRAGTDERFTNNQGLPTFGRDYLSAVTEAVSAGVVQAWDFYNTTGDTHPWHFHLVNVQVVGRGKFGTNGNETVPVFGSFTDLQGNPGRLTPPDANERGWKETVRMNPGEITRVIMRFDLPKLPAVMGDPLSPRTGGHEYVHHCHILEHEEHDMMRPLVVG
jgi:spore coat protein A, manganese oxidase